jgi:2',3'-cyclic-nucleotide 2'-phosphodiesterase (5'-nucleotidase family)
MSTRRTSRLPRVLAATAAAVAVVALSSATALASGPASAAGDDGHRRGHEPRHRPSQREGQIQLLSFNDLHGNLEPPAGSGGRITTGYTESTTTPPAAVPTTVDAGGTEYLATHLAKARAGHRNTATVAAGDLIGASPLLSAAFHDEPTIEAMNALGLDATAVGNHEFDEGYRELQRMQYGGCIDDGAGQNNQNSCADHTFAGADFPILAANVHYTGSKRTILPPYWVKRFPDGAKIGFIGMTLKETPTIVTRSGIEGLTFEDEAATANALVPRLMNEGVKAIVVLLHQGGTPATTTFTAEHGAYTVAPPYDATCSTQTKNGIKGAQLTDDSPVLDITRRLDPQIDMVISGHTHQPYVCSQADPLGQQRLITSASSFGRLFTETSLTYDLRRGDIKRSSVKGTNLVVTRDVAKDGTQAALVARYKKLVKPIESKVLGQVAGGATLPRTSASDVETSLGRLIADAQKNDASVVSGGRAPQIAFMNPGGIRSDLVPAANGDVTYGAAFAVQPFNNYVVSMDMTGQQIYDLLEQQFSGGNAGSASKVLQVSEGFAYSYRVSAAPGSKVVDGSVTLDGTPISRTATYRVAANSFLSDGGDNFAAFTSATNKLIGGLDIDAFAAYLTAHSPYQPVAEDRITQLP